MKVIVQKFVPLFTMSLLKKRNNPPIGLNNEKVIGHLICDEMKLKDNIFGNCQSNSWIYLWW